MIDGLPKVMTINAVEVEKVLSEGLISIIDAAKEVLEQTPPELAADIIDRGIMLTGGGALLNNLDRLLAHHLKVPVIVAENSLDAVAIGTGILLDNIAKRK